MWKNNVYGLNDLEISLFLFSHFSLSFLVPGTLWAMISTLTQYRMDTPELNASLPFRGPLQVLDE